MMHSSLQGSSAGRAYHDHSNLFVTLPLAMNVLVLGANGQLGRAVFSRLAADGQRVRAFMRRPASVVAPPAIEVFQGDAMQEAAVREAAVGQEAVVDAIGSGTLRYNTIESDTTRVVLGALRGFQGWYLAMS